MKRTGAVLALLGLSALVGGMLFFGTVMAPLVFQKLPAEVAGPFIRAAFPRYYAFIAVSGGVGCLGFALRGRGFAAATLLLLVLVTIGLWLWLIPHMEALRLAGDEVDFGRAHFWSVIVNAVQLLVALGLLVRAAGRL